MTELQRPQPQKPQIPGAPKRPEIRRQDPKTTLTMLKWTTGLSAVALTLAGWGLLARAETVNAVTATGLDQTAPASLTLGAAASAKLASLGGPGQAGSAAGLISSATTGGTARSAAAAAVLATPTRGAAAAATDIPTATPTDAPTNVPTGVPTEVPTAVPTPAPTDTPEVKFKLDVVQWVQNQAGDMIAVVRDNQGILWYVWGDDVPRIEQGLSPQYQPVPVNQFGRSRHS
ncbi:MAG: hypothetical protein U0X20_18770 [Caldilineaceae bacterium]